MSLSSPPKGLNLQMFVIIKGLEKLYLSEFTIFDYQREKEAKGNEYPIDE